jgi:hypothetical protein
VVDLPVYLEQVVRNFNRYHKDRLRTDQRQQSRKLVTVIIRGTSRRERRPVFAELCERPAGRQVSLRIGTAVQAF